MEIVSDTTTATDSTREPDTDRAFEVLADGGRRAVIDELSKEGSATFDDLVRRLANRHGSEERAKVALVHRHLPKLRNAGVVTFDSETREVAFDDAGDVLAVLGAVSDRIE